MSVATATAMYSINSAVNPLTVAGAWPQVTPNPIGGTNQDLLQIINQGGNILVNVDSSGTVHFPAVNPTQINGINNARIGVFFTRLASTNTLAQIFADAFSNAAQLDIIQVQNAGGSIHYNLNYLGVASGS